MLRTLELELELELVRALRVSASKPQSHQQDKHQSSRGHQQNIRFHYGFGSHEWLGAECYRYHIIRVSSISVRGTRFSDMARKGENSRVVGCWRATRPHPRSLTMYVCVYVYV